jgi:phosphoadenosine phosphosulfate reductase
MGLGPEPGGNPFANTSKFLNELSKRHDAIVVSYSGGKDSLAVLDLCCKTFNRVTCFLMWFVPGMGFDRDNIAFAKERFNVEVIQYPHWAAIKAMRHGVYCTQSKLVSGFPEWNLHDIHAMVMQDTGINLIAHGGKKTDSMWRRRNLKNTANRTEVIYPLLNWNRWEVLAYLKRNDIPVPEQEGHSNSGIDLCTPSVLWLHDNRPDDFAILEKWFPYVRAVVHRREFYGVT